MSRQRARTQQSIKAETEISVNYRIPNPLESLEQAQKFDHQDLLDLDTLDLWREGRRVETALAFHDRNWLIERLAAVRREQRERERGRCR